MSVAIAWKIAGSLLAVPLLAIGTVQTASVVAHDEHTEQTEVTAAGVAALEVHDAAGSVRIVGVENATTITVRAHISDGLRPTGHSIERAGDRVQVRGSCPNIGETWCSVDYTIEVPSDLDVTVRSDGHIELADVSGAVDAGTDSSSIELARVSGDVRLEADQGRIEATDLRADHVRARADQGRIRLVFSDSPRSVDVTADQGDIDVLLPDERGVAYDTDTGADQGTVTDPIRQDPGSDRTISAHADQGDVTVSYTTG